MENLKDLLTLASSGQASAFQDAFNTELQARIADRIDELRYADSVEDPEDEEYFDDLIDDDDDLDSYDDETEEVDDIVDDDEE